MGSRSRRCRHRRPLIRKRLRTRFQAGRQVAFPVGVDVGVVDRRPARPQPDGGGGQPQQCETEDRTGVATDEMHQPVGEGPDQPGQRERHQPRDHHAAGYPQRTSAPGLPTPLPSTDPVATCVVDSA